MIKEAEGRPRAVITGLGLATPVGSGVKKFWEALTAGQSGIGPITLFDASGSSVQIGGEVRDLDFRQYIPIEQLRRMSRATKLAVVAAKQALEDSGLEITDENREQIDIYLGIACPDLDTLATNMVRRHQRGESGVNPMAPAMIVPSAPAANVSLALGIAGETTTISTSCSSSTNALGHALRKIRSGESQIIFAGGTEAGVQADLIAAFANAQALSRRNTAPQEASRPFEAHRDGHVLSEASGILVLEEYEHARARGARIYAELVGYGVSSDCFSAVNVSENVDRAARCLRQALQDAGRSADDVDFYCAHGSSARLTDARETRMFKQVLRERAYRVPVSGIKSMTGHPFGASGALQAATCALAIYRRAVPPTINYDEPDPECDLDYVPNEARAQRVSLALLYSLGLGGNNAALVLAAC